MTAPIAPAPIPPLPLPPVANQNLAPPLNVGDPDDLKSGREPITPSSAQSIASARAVINLPNGGSYVGGMERKMWHGHGKLTNPDGSYYDGMWNQGRREGEGEEYIPQAGIKRKGPWQQDLKHGNFLVTRLSDGYVYQETYTNGVPSNLICCVIL